MSNKYFEQCFACYVKTGSRQCVPVLISTVVMWCKLVSPFKPIIEERHCRWIFINKKYMLCVIYCFHIKIGLFWVKMTKLAIIVSTKFYEKKKDWVRFKVIVLLCWHIQDCKLDHGKKKVTVHQLPPCPPGVPKEVMYHSLHGNEEETSCF